MTRPPMLHSDTPPFHYHRSDSNQGSDCVAIFVSLISGLGSHDSVGNSCLSLNKDIDVDIVPLVL